MSNVISSRTPEGEPNDCPVCRSALVIEPSQPAGDAPCPKCGTLLWFVKTPGGTRYHPAAEIAPIREQVVGEICRSLGVPRDEVNDSTSLSAISDSVAIVELVMELEDMVGGSLPDIEAEAITTVGQLIDAIARHRTLEA